MVQTTPNLKRGGKGNEYRAKKIPMDNSKTYLELQGDSSVFLAPRIVNRQRFLHNFLDKDHANGEFQHNVY